MQSVIADTRNIARRYHHGFPVARIGFLMPNHPEPPTTYTGKLEFCLRLSAADGAAAEDVIDGCTYTTPFPHVILKLPHSVHTYACPSEREAVYIQFPPEAEEELRRAGFLDTPRIWPISLTPEISSLVLKLRELTDRLLEPGMIDRIDSFALLLLQELLGQERREKDAADREIRRKIDRVASHFHLHFGNDIDMAKLLRANGLSLRTFQRHWKEFHALPPAEYLRELRLEHVRTLLLESSLPLYEIACRSNFRHTYYLCRLFRERYGMTPRQYRMAAAHGQPPPSRS